MRKSTIYLLHNDLDPTIKKLPRELEKRIVFRNGGGAVAGIRLGSNTGTIQGGYAFIHEDARDKAEKEIADAIGGNFSAEMSATLIIGKQQYAIGAMASKTFRLQTPINHRPCNAVLKITIDGKTERREIMLTHGMNTDTPDVVYDDKNTRDF